MTLVDAIILGLVQGLTEFIPVSSSGHLVLFHEVLGRGANDLLFDVALHIGTLLALIVFFYKDLIVYARSLFVRGPHTHLAHLLLLATVPAAVAGYLLESSAETIFRSPKLVAVNLIIFGLIMIGVDTWYQRQSKHTKLDNIRRNQALAAGFSQALAVVPGVSRSGSTIVAGMLAGLDRVAATRFSFLLGIPIITGATLKVVVFDLASEQATADPILLLVGIVTACLSGLFAIRFILKFLANNGLETFGYYRIGLGVVVLILLSMW